MVSTRSQTAGKATATRTCDPSVLSHDLFPSRLHRALPAGQDVCGRQFHTLRVEIADLACLHATPRHEEMKETVDLRRGFSPTHRASSVLSLSVAAIPQEQRAFSGPGLTIGGRAPDTIGRMIGLHTPSRRK